VDDRSLSVLCIIGSLDLYTIICLSTTVSDLTALSIEIYIISLLPPLLQQKLVGDAISLTFILGIRLTLTSISFMIIF
jgi:hypothetical protein